MKSSKDVKRDLERLARAWPDDDSIVESVMREVRSASITRGNLKRRKIIMRSFFGVAASLLLGTVVWLVPLVSIQPSVTLAQVAQAVARQKWMHVEYDNGSKLWVTLDGEQRYKETPTGHITCLNSRERFRSSYEPANGHIYEGKMSDYGVAPPPWTPQTLSEIVGFSMDLPEGEADAEKKSTGRYMERHADTLDDRPMMRFDQYATNSLEQVVLSRQIWVDTETHLPVRVRAFLQLGLRKDPDERYTTGDYEFSDEGPNSLYDLGVPRDAPIVATEERDPNQDVARVLDLARQARDHFPTRYRLLVWANDDSQSNIHAIYRDGAPNRERQFTDWQSVRVRESYYFNMQKEHPHYHLPLPATADQVLAWTKNHVPTGLSLCDGTRQMFKRGPLPAPHEQKTVRLQVIRLHSLPLDDQFWPTHYQWPMVDVAGTPSILDEGREELPGTIALRTERGSNRSDYYLDPKRDHVCIKWVWWSKTADGWFKKREYELLDLEQLPDGQWHAARRRLVDYGSPDGRIGGSDRTWTHDLRLLAEDEFPADVFNGDKLLEESKRDGAIIEAN